LNLFARLLFAAECIHSSLRNISQRTYGAWSGTSGALGIISRMYPLVWDQLISDSLVLSRPGVEPRV
jgi:hypothetical protein